MTTKKCSYCAEEIQAEAIKCKHCGTDFQVNADVEKKNVDVKKKKFNWKVAIVLIILAPFAISAFIDGFTGSSEKSKNEAISAQAQADEIKKFVLQNEPKNEAYVFDNDLHNRVFKVNLIEPALAFDFKEQGVTFSSKEMEDNYYSVSRVDTIKSDSKVSVYDNKEIESSGKKESFSLVKFNNLQNQESAGWIPSKLLLLEKDYLAISKKFKSTREGELFYRYPEWSYLEIIKIAGEQYWIGMSYNMLTESLGLPDSANPSNYGSGTKWQWCWTDRSPMCFYDNNGDQIIDAFN